MFNFNPHSQISRTVPKRIVETIRETLIGLKIVNRKGKRLIDIHEQNKHITYYSKNLVKQVRVKDEEGNCISNRVFDESRKILLRQRKLANNRTLSVEYIYDNLGNRCGKIRMY